jgi:two-component system, response regulator RegA
LRGDGFNGGGSNGDGNGAGRTLLLAHDPDVCEKIAPGLAAHGFHLCVTHSAADALKAATVHRPAFAVIELRLPDGSGLRLLPALLRLDCTTRIVVLTGYPSIETAVEAIKLGAVHYLVKPARAERVVAALFRGDGNPDVAVLERPMSVKRAAWEYVHHVLHEHNGNISAAARALSIDRRTLQRQLRKRPVSA